MKHKDYYEVLGVSKSADKKAIRKAYAALAKKYHPDVSHASDAEERFKEVQEAYEVLRDDEKRKQYDEWGADWQEKVQWQQGQARETRQRYSSGEGMDAGGYSDFFNMFFGGGRGGGNVFAEDDFGRSPFREASYGGADPYVPDEEVVLYLSLEQAAKGGSVRVHVNGKDLDIKLPEGIYDGRKIRLKGQSSGSSSKGGAKGDPYITLKIKPDQRFTIDDGDLHAVLQVAPWQAALGTEAKVRLPDESTVNVRVPQGIKPGQKLRIADKGLMKANGERGHLFFAIDVVVPPPSSAKEKELYAQLAQLRPFRAGIK